MNQSVLEQVKAEDFTSTDAYEKVRFLFYSLWLEKESYRKQAFGSKTERFVPENPLQLLFDGLNEEEKKALSIQIGTHTRRLKKKDHPGRNILPAHLERKETVIVPDEVQGKENEFVRIGEEVSEVLEMNPAKFWVRRTVRPKFKNCQSEQIICAPYDDRLFPRLMAGYSVIAHILTAKYADHLPLYRIRKQFGRDRVDISEATMVGWIAFACVYLEVLYNRLLAKIAEARIIQADESPMPVVEEGKEHTHRGYMFVYIVDKKYVIYNYKHGRGANGPVEFLKGFSGVLQTDGYNGYNEAVRLYKLIHVACMAHIRRKFFEAFEKGETVCGEALTLIKKLYAIEEDLKGSDEVEIKRQRKTYSLPVLNSLRDWSLLKRKSSLPQGPTGKAISYFLEEYPKMVAYVENAQADIDNNLCERTIRPMTIGRKNYLFAGNEPAAHRAAVIYSLVLTCRLYGRDPYAYFIKVFKTMEQEPNTDLDLLLPDRLPP